MEEPTIPVSVLRAELALLPDDALLSFCGLTYQRVKQRGPNLHCVEFNEQVCLDEQGRVVVQTLK